jgi:hypothetical protein
MDYLKYAAKAVVAALIAGLGSLITVLVGDVGFGDVTDGQWVAVVLSAIVAAGAVFGITNGPKPT